MFSERSFLNLFHDSRTLLDSMVTGNFTQKTFRTSLLAQVLDRSHKCSKNPCEFKKCSQKLKRKKVNQLDDISESSEEEEILSVSLTHITNAMDMSKFKNKIFAHMEIGNEWKYHAEFAIIDEDYTPLLGSSAAQQMRLITVQQENILQVKDSYQEQDTEWIIVTYPDVFQGLGCMEGVLHLEVDESASPSIMPLVVSLSPWENDWKRS